MSEQSEEYSPALCWFAILFCSSAFYLEPAVCCIWKNQLSEHLCEPLRFSNSNRYDLGTLTIAISSHQITGVRDLTARAVDTVISNKKEEAFVTVL